MEKEFIQLINAHHGILLKICNAYFYSSSYKEDYYQEILIRLWKAFPNFKRQSTFSTWMYRVALNAAIDIIRKQNVQTEYVEFLENVHHKADNSEAILDNYDRLYRAINALPEAERAVILLYLEEYEYKEIAAITGISEVNVGVKINRIKCKLNKILKNGKE